MSKERIQICEEFFDIMPPEYQDMVTNATWGKEGRGWKDVGINKELIEQHSLCAGCPEAMAFRYILASLPNPEDTVMVGSTGCTSLVFPHVGVHNIHSLFGNQNAIASGLKRALSVRFPDRVKDVVVLAGDGATVDIGLDYTPCILEIGKNSMEGLQEMRDSEKPGERFAYKEYVSDEAKAFLADLAEKEKAKKASAKEA